MHIYKSSYKNLPSRQNYIEKTLHLPSCVNKLHGFIKSYYILCTLYLNYFRKSKYITVSISNTDTTSINNTDTTLHSIYSVLNKCALLLK